MPVPVVRLAALAAALALAGCGTVERTADAVDAAAGDFFAAVGERLPAGARGPAQPQPDIGIVGTVTGAAAGEVEVNGLPVATRPATVLHGGFGPAGPLGAGTIPPGHVVEIAAERQAGRLVAREIEPIFALAGPVGAVEPGMRRLVVMGADVLVPPDAVLPAGGFAAFRPGQKLAVSGLWRGEELIASRIDLQSPEAAPQAVVSGVVAPLPGARYRIGGVQVAAEPGALRPGFFHVVSGHWVADALLARDIRLGRSVVGRWPIEALAVEAYGRARDFAGFYSGYPGPDRDGYWAGYTFTGREGKIGDDPAWRDHFVALGGLGRPVEERDREIAIVDDIRALFVGEYEDGLEGEFDVDYIIPLPEALAARRAVLAAVGDPFTPATGALYID